MNSDAPAPNVPAANGVGSPSMASAEHPKSGKSREEIYLELAKMCQQSFETRRSYEWKIAFGLWTAIGLITYFATAHAGAICGCGLCWLAVAYILVGVAWAIFWQPLVHSANRWDKKWKHYYMHRAENRPEDRSAADPWRDESSISWKQEQAERFAELLHAWSWVQITVTWVLLVVSLAIIQASSDPTAPPRDKDSISVSGDNATKVIDKLTK